jgi:hypothetical protein
MYTQSHASSCRTNQHRVQHSTATTAWVMSMAQPAASDRYQHQARQPPAPARSSIECSTDSTARFACMHSTAFCLTHV